MNDETEFRKIAPDVEQLAGESDSAEPDTSPERVLGERILGDALARERERQLAGQVELRPCGLEAVHAAHDWHGTTAIPGGTCPGVADQADDLGTYADMFAEYLAGQKHWIGAAQRPLVFHIRKLCQKLDADPNAAASYASAYLQAVSRLDRQRPGNTAAGVAGDPAGAGQRSIFDELD